MGRPEEACAQLLNGLARARSEGLLYEEALLLLTEGELGLWCEDGPEQMMEKALGLLRTIGVRDRPGL